MLYEVITDFVGFGNLHTLLIHRGMYFFFGLGFIFYTVLFLKRLPQSDGVRYISNILGTACVIFALYLGYSHINGFLNDRNLREDMLNLNESFLGTAAVDVTDYDINIKHEGEQIEVTSKLKVKNTQQSALKNVIFSLSYNFV